MKRRDSDSEGGHTGTAPIVDAMTRVKRPPADAEFDAALVRYIDDAMQRGDVQVERVSFGAHSIEFDFGRCTLTCYTQIEWLDASGKRRLIDVEHAEHPARHATREGALVRLLGRRATAARLLPEGVQIDIESAGTLHFSRIDGGVSFELLTAQFGPALY